MGFSASTGLALVLLASGCASSKPRQALTMEPIGTVPNVPRTVDEPDTGDAGVTAPNSAGMLNPPHETGASGCAGGEFEKLEDALKGCEGPTPKISEVRGLRSKLEIKATALSASTTPGGRVDFDVVLRNKSNEPLPLYFSGDPLAKLEPEVFDGKGRRADVPAGKAPPWPKGTPPPTHDAKAYRVTLPPEGTLKLKVAWDAVKTRWAPEKAKTWDGRGYPRTNAGTLLVGKYTVKFPLPLIGAFEKGELDIPKVAVDVTP